MNYKKEIYFEYSSNNNISNQATILSLIKALDNSYSLVYNSGGNVFLLQIQK